MNILYSAFYILHSSSWFLAFRINFSYLNVRKFSTMIKTNIKGLSLQELEAFILSLQEKRYRAQQIFRWLYQYRVNSFKEMTDLSQQFREALEEKATIDLPRITARQLSDRDGTTKYLIELSDGKKIETVLIPPRSGSLDEDKRLTLCISTQVGCPLDCKFCATGTMGFTRNLTTGEIVDQVLLAQSESPKPITNIVCMGMGEPMLNYDNVMAAIDILSSPFGPEISPRRITVSTAGYAGQIRRMADEKRKVNLALSLHSLDVKTRSALMPITQKHSIDELIDGLEYYYRATRKSVMLEYILFDGINNTDADIKKLAKVARRFPCRVNLIPFHSIAFTGAGGITQTLCPASREQIEQFSKKLRDADVTVFIRDSSGEDIDAACGQLAIRAKAE
jgi:23S rRNA (adenine2503-C2)-methyltransferase